MEPHPFWIVTGVCHAFRNPDGYARLVDEDMVWIVATCLTPEEAIAVRATLVGDMTKLVANPAFNSGLVFMSTWLTKFARDPFLVKNADAIARRMRDGNIPSYDVYRSYDDFTKIAELVVAGVAGDGTP